MPPRGIECLNPEKNHASPKHSPRNPSYLESCTCSAESASNFAMLAICMGLIVNLGILLSTAEKASRAQSEQEVRLYI